MPDITPRYHPLTISLAAGVIGFAVNAFNPSVFGGTGVVFGGAAAMMVALCHGPWWGLLAAVIAGSRTLLEWGHPLGLLTFSLEAVVVGWLSTHRNFKPLRSDLAFWLLLGFPLSLAGTWSTPDIPFPGYWAIAIKMPVNGLIATLIATVASEFVGHRWPNLLEPRWTRGNSLQLLLFQRFGIQAGLPIAILGLYVGHVFDNNRRAEATAELVTATLGTAEDVGSHLDQHRRALITLARQAELSGDYRPATLATQLEALRREYTGFLTLLVANEQGEIVATASAVSVPGPGADGRLLSVADRDYFRHAVQQKRPFVSEVFRGRGLGRDLIVAISAPVVDAAGRVRLVVEGSLNLRQLTDVIGRVHSTTPRELVVTDGHNRVVSSTGALALPALTSFSGHTLFAAAGSALGRTFMHDHPVDGQLHPERHIASSARVPGFTWQVYLQEPIWRYQRDIALFYLTVLTGSALIIALSLVLASGASAVLTQPLNQLVATARALASGTPTEASLDMSRAPLEIAELSHDVHAAALRLNLNNLELERTNAELRELARTLDHRVQERTAELEEARALAESANRAKSEFLASMSHELRTPLSVILGNTSLLEEGLLGALSDRQRESLHGIDESGRHLLSLINDILDLSKVEAGMLELDHAEVGAVEVVEASLRLIRPDAAKKSLDLETSVDCAPDTTFVGDGRRVKQILVNLLSNAVKFTPAGGRITVRLGLSADGAAIQFVVSDTGIGIALELQRKLFRPFVQIDSRLAREYSGTGLGLALVKQFADLHGGSVSLVSEPGRGSTFTVSLPARRETTSRAPFAALAVAGPKFRIAGRPRVLIAEDHETNIAVLRAFFNSQSCQATFARDGVDAIERAFASAPDIILMDVQMPRMDGLEAIKRLRADPRTARIPIICLTALAMADDQERCLAAGANEYLFKPVNFPTLTASINRLVAAHPPPA
ncbi:MAG: response regulator [Verrucomicrobia bacterium]|nr:response regulator [Verrucomicrobiota bacterium]